MARATLICLALLAAGLGASGSVPEAQDSFSDIYFEIKEPTGARSRGRTAVEIRVGAREVGSCSLVATIAVPEGA